MRPFSQDKTLRNVVQCSPFIRLSHLAQKQNAAYRSPNLVPHQITWLHKAEMRDAYKMSTILSLQGGPRRPIVSVKRPQIFLFSYMYTGTFS